MIAEIVTDDVWVLGVTAVGRQLFVLLWRDDKQVAVYSIDDCKLLHHINVPGLETDSDIDITSCERHKCLYVSNRCDSCIHRYALSNEAVSVLKRMSGKRSSKWSVAGLPCGLSVIPGSSNLLVTCDHPTNKLVELSADSGQFVREITLHSDIRRPHHAVQLTTGQVVVCYGVSSDELHRVCMVDHVKGRVTRSYGGQRGSGVGQLNAPRHLDADEDSQFIIVADYRNHRVVLLSPTLEFVHEFSEVVSYPRRLYYHHATRRLFVGQSSYLVTVIQL